jgi:hypothetical protein
MPVSLECDFCSDVGTLLVQLPAKEAGQKRHCQSIRVPSQVRIQQRRAVVQRPNSTSLSTLA